VVASAYKGPKQSYSCSLPKPSAGEDCARLGPLEVSAKLAYTIPQAVDASGISRSTLYTFIKSKQLPVVKIGQRTLIRSVDLSEFINQRLVA
jgi:excisionase family DNA binding protein